jgi:hypothetical protein
MEPASSREIARARDVIRRLFAGEKNLRLREQILLMHSSCGQFKSLGIAMMEALAAVAQMDREDWEVYMYGEINDAIHWMARLERDILEVGGELRRLIKKREDDRRQVEAVKEEKAYAARDLIAYERYLEGFRVKEEGDADAGTDRGGPPAGGASQAGGGSAGETGAGSGRGDAPEADGAAQHRLPDGRVPDVRGEALAKARGILGG